MTGTTSQPAGRPQGTAAVARLKRGLGLIAAFVLFAMMALTVVDVTGRYAFNSPVAGGFEVMQFLLAILVFTALPIVSHERGHITVSLLDALFKGAARRIQQFGVLLVSAVAMAVIAQRMWDQGNVLSDTEAITGFLQWPIAPVAYAMSVLAAVALALILLLLWRNLRGDVFADIGGGSAD